MKNIFLLLIFSYTLIANQYSSIPTSIETILCKVLEQSNYSPTNTCQNGSKIVYNKHFPVDNDKVLLFLYLDEAQQNYNNYPPRKVALLVDKKGTWTKVRGKNIIDESIQSIEQDPYSGIWINSLSGIESSTPTLYFSQNGFTLHKIVLPKSTTQNKSYHDIQQICFQKNSIILKMNSASGREPMLWETAYTKAISRHPNWKQRFNKNIKCQNYNKKKQWNSVQYQNHILLSHSQTKKQIEILTSNHFIKNRFYVQIGAFTNKKYAENIQKQLQSLHYKTSIQKRKVGINTYLKLLIGSFDSYQEAQSVKRKLLKKYPGAFILKEEDR